MIATGDTEIQGFLHCWKQKRAQAKVVLILGINCRIITDAKNILNEEKYFMKICIKSMSREIMKTTFSFRFLIL